MEIAQSQFKTAEYDGSLVCFAKLSTRRVNLVILFVPVSACCGDLGYWAERRLPKMKTYL